MKTKMRFLYQNRLGFVIAVLLLLCEQTVLAQGTAFTYQGKLSDGGNPANGNYDLQFALFDSLAFGNQIGSTLPRANTNVAGGIFTVQLDFGVNAFPGANRFLEIGVRPVSSGGFTTLSPRQQISSTPYAIRTLNATAADSLSNACVACVQDAQINSLSGSKVSGTVPLGSVPAGSGNYIQNTTTPQSAHFNVSGNGTIGGNLITNNNVGIGATNPFARLQVASAGNSATSYTARFQSSPSVAGAGGILFDQNSIFGWKIHTENTGFTDGFLSFNYVNVSNGSVQAANPLVLHGNGKVGIGEVSPTSRLHITGMNPLLTLQSLQEHSIMFFNGSSGGWQTGRSTSGAYFIQSNDFLAQFLIKPDGSVGIRTTVPQRLLHVGGRARIDSMPMEPSSGSVCLNSFGDLLQCGNSSLTSKKNITLFRNGLDIVRRLRPISFDWKDGSGHDIGLGAEDVAKVAPSFTFTDKKGEVAGVKYERLNILLINAVKEQQKEIEELRARVRTLEKNRRKRVR